MDTDDSEWLHESVMKTFNGRKNVQVVDRSDEENNNPSGFQIAGNPKVQQIIWKLQRNEEFQSFIPTLPYRSQS